MWSEVLLNQIFCFQRCKRNYVKTCVWLPVVQMKIDSRPCLTFGLVKKILMMIFVFFNLVFLTDCSRDFMLLGYFLVGCGCRPAENISLANMNKFSFQKKITLLYWKAAIITYKIDDCFEPFILKILIFGFFSCLMELVRKHRKIYFG